MFDFDEYLSILSGDEFEEKPVTPEVFVTSPEYLGMKSDLSPEQYKMMHAATQIFRYDTLLALYGKQYADQRIKETFNECIFMLGKGSGKDHTSEVSLAYVVYQLMCLRSPQNYYGLEDGTAIDIINIAINAEQANRVFFKGFLNIISKAPWFAGKYSDSKGAINFDKSINVYSGHSERESFEGYNTFMVVLDEIAGFAMDNNTGNAKAKTAEEVYLMYSASVTSRHPEFGKTILLSFPRYQGDFISKRYEEVIAEKTTVIHVERLVLNPELPEDMEGNFIEFEWEEDFITAYTEPGVYALRRPSWIMNPLRKITDYTRDFFRNMTDALMRFACMPPLAIDGLFKDGESVLAAFSEPLKVLEDGTIMAGLRPEEGKEYYIHVDLAQKVDRCAVSMAHVDSWTRSTFKGAQETVDPVIVVDLIRYWTPSPGKTVDFREVRDFITSLSLKGFNIKLITFDRWNSVDMMEYLEQKGLAVDRLSVAKQHYIEMLAVVNERRCKGPDIDLVRKELVQLRVIKDKVDHPRDGSKDLADATCGAIFNALAHTQRDQTKVVDIKTLDDLRYNKPANLPAEATQRATGPIPDDLARYLDSLTVL